jgi:allophanate hydrolase
MRRAMRAAGARAIGGRAGMAPAYTKRYTSWCTNLTPTPSSLLTLADWSRAYRDGLAPGALLKRFAYAAAPPDVAWIQRADAALLNEQIDALREREAALGSREAALRAMPLFGVPYAVKDNIDVRAWCTTAACPAAARTAEADAHVVARLRDAGAICVGKTNLDQFATGLVGTRSPYGRPASAFSAVHVSGGSSSGSAVVVARGLVPFALGTDTAGSGRVPAGFNNLVGLKPTPGRVGTSGVVPACRTLDCVSIFALTVDDAARVLSLIEGEDPADDYSACAPRHAAWRTPLRLGVPAAPQLDAAYREPWAQALQRARELGCEIVEIDFAPLHRVAELLYDGPWVAERHAAVQALLGATPEAIDPVVRQVIEGALRFSATDAFRGQYTLRALQRDAARTWQAVDLLMVPTAPGHPRFADVDADPIGANARLGTYTNFVNLLGWCALALPSGLTAEGLPFGATFIATGQQDAALAEFGARWQREAALPLGATGRAMPEGGLSLRPAGELVLPLAVVGAHLSGLPLNGQLLERGARLRETTTTAAAYRLFALPGTTPPKPGLLRAAGGGEQVAVEVWELPLREVGSFLALVPSPLGLGSVELADGRRVHGFVCESWAVDGAEDITAFGGWRAYLSHLSQPDPSPLRSAA